MHPFPRLHSSALAILLLAAPLPFAGTAAAQGKKTPPANKKVTPAPAPAAAAVPDDPAARGELTDEMLAFHQKIFSGPEHFLDAFGKKGLPRRTQMEALFAGSANHELDKMVTANRIFVSTMTGRKIETDEIWAHERGRFAERYLGAGENEVASDRHFYQLAAVKLAALKSQEDFEGFRAETNPGKAAHRRATAAAWRAERDLAHFQREFGDPVTLLRAQLECPGERNAAPVEAPAPPEGGNGNASPKLGKLELANRAFYFEMCGETVAAETDWPAQRQWYASAALGARAGQPVNDPLFYKLAAAKLRDLKNDPELVALKRKPAWQGVKVVSLSPAKVVTGGGSGKGTGSGSGTAATKADPAALQAEVLELRERVAQLEGMMVKLLAEPGVREKTAAEEKAPEAEAAAEAVAATEAMAKEAPKEVRDAEPKTEEKAATDLLAMWKSYKADPQGFEEKIKTEEPSVRATWEKLREDMLKLEKE